MDDSPPAKRIKLEDADSKEDVGVSTPRPPSKTIDVHSHGDIILEARSDQRAIALRVSSGVLTAASQSWVDLLGVNSRESNSTRTTDKPKRVLMSADDPSAILDLCRILHHRLDQVDGSRGSPLLAIALVCNKHACEESLRLWMSIQLEKHLQSAQGPMTTLKPLTPPSTPTSIESPEELSVLEIMGIAYLFNDAEHFWTASKNLDHTFRMAQELECLLPKPLMSMLRERRSTGLNAIRAEVENIVNNLFKTPSTADHNQVHLTEQDQPLGNGSVCKQTLLTVGYIMGSLSSVGLWPKRVVDQDQTYSVAEYLDRLEAIAVWRKPGSKSTQSKCKAAGCGPCRNLDVRELLLEIVARRRKELTGMCLGCVKDGRYAAAFRKVCRRHGLDMNADV